MKILDYVKRKCTRGFWHTYNFVTFKSKRKQKHGFAQYTIVSACYNVAPYLDEYFTSIVNQSLLFSNNIFIVCVDDGSTDETADIIKSWQKKYPDNITYIYKENGGQASARNLGMQYVKTPYVTFTDSDDFLDKNYFKYVDDFLKKSKNKDICMLCTPLIFYFEDRKVYKNTHPLKFKFTKDTILPISKITKEIQMHAASTIFKSSHIMSLNVLFNVKIKPCFEDAHFVASYLLAEPDSFVAYLKNAIYYYRKRVAKNSTLDTVWSHKGKFSDVFFYGHIDLLQKRNALREDVPKYLNIDKTVFIKNTVLYDFTWYIKTLVNNPERMNLLNDDEKQRFLQLVKECFSYIEPLTILRFSLAGAWFYHKVGMLHCFKGEAPEFQIVYIERYDAIKKEVLIRYFTGVPIQEDFYVGTERIEPTHRKTSHDDFCGETFVLQQWVWLPVGAEGTTVLKIGLNGKLAKISLRGKQHNNGLALQHIFNAFPQELRAESKYKDCWIVMDRNTEADDNGEFFYRYLMMHNLHSHAYFVLENTSKDWERLQELGFQLLAYGSKTHETALRACSKIISSSIDAYVINYFKNNSLNNKHIVFLQHGVTKDDISRWLNSKPRIDVFVTSTQAEYDSIVSNDSRYKFGTKEVRLTGFPRHDFLLGRAKTHQKQKKILIQPTWRQNILGKPINGVSTKREISSEFMNSEYAQHWQSFLCSEKLATLTKSYEYEIIFFPHPNIQPYLEQFHVPEHIKLLSREGISMQDYFLDASCMITDYSSVAFDMAYLEKPVLYYQFDREDFFSTAHTYQAGYFDYTEHGFGPVCEQEDTLFDALETLLRNDCEPDSEYAQRIKTTFSYRDGKCCERVYKTIVDLDVKLS